MTFTEIVDRVMDDLRLTTTDATTRVGQKVNNRYRRVRRAVGLNDVRRKTFPFALALNTRTQTVNGIQKLNAIVDNTDTSAPRLLYEILDSEMDEVVPTENWPERWSVKRVGASSVTFKLDTNPTAARTLDVTGDESPVTLVGGAIPDFPEMFHEILVIGAKADEYRKAEKIPLARDEDKAFDDMLAELRYYMATRQMLTIQQGKDNMGQLRQPDYSRAELRK